MIYRFISINEFLKSFQVELINFLHDYDLLTCYSIHTKKVILFFFMNKLNELLKDHSIILYHNHILSEDYELLEHYDKEKLTKFIDKLCSTVKKLTKRLIFIRTNKTLPLNARIDEVDGGIVDELILLNEKDVDLKDLKKFLDKCRLQDLFSGISMHVSF